VDYRDPPSSDPSASGVSGESPGAPVGPLRPRQRRRGMKIPYPLVPPTADQVLTWEDHYIWGAARSRARDNCGRMMRAKGLNLPPISAEWDPPIPEPINAGEKPRIPLKAVLIPDGWDFSPYALSAERQAEWEALLVPRTGSPTAADQAAPTVAGDTA
jgi:hypothetical protein